MSKSTMVVLVAGVVLLVTAVQPAFTAPILVSYWTADGNALDSVDSHQGSLTGGATYVTGKIGQAFNFNGTNGYVNVPDSADLRISDAVTITTWVKRTRTDGIDIILEKGGDWTDGQTNYGLGLHQNSLNNMFYFFFAGGWRGSSPVNDTNWHFLTVVAQQGMMNPAFYIDGVSQPTLTSGGVSNINLYSSTASLHVGAQVANYTYYGTNTVDEVGIWHGAMTAQEVQTLYEAGGRAPEPATMSLLALGGIGMMFRRRGLRG